MPTHDFALLSSFDFEELIRDLLQADWRIRLESFTAGRDQGIDLRCLRGRRRTLIVQCKHALGSGYRQLLSQIRHVELPKVRALAPSRYVLATSVGLTPLNKQDLADLLHPFVRREADILGREDINNLLRLHPKVEIDNFKLWLTSAPILERVLHNAERCKTEFEVERVCRRLPIFVQNDAFPRAQEILNETRIVIITGVPGIGKTTVADMLLYAHLEQGYEPVVIQDSVEEGRRMFKKFAKQIFYFDDFLGQTFLGDSPGHIENNQDAALVAFMDAIRHTKSSRFILTTREHILRKALHVSERLAQSPLLDHRCILAMSDYSFAQKARILYNHLYFSDLPRAYKQEIITNDFYLEVIKHRNFNPRLIEWLSGYIRIRRIVPEHYREHIAQILDSPEQIWSHAFEHQISEGARNVLFCLWSLRGSKELSDFRPAWQSLHEHAARRYNRPISPNDFRRALEELEESFTSISNQRISFLNPSIREFVENVLRGNADHVANAIASAVRFEQIINFWKLSTERPTESLTPPALADMPTVPAALKRLLHSSHIRWDKQADGHTYGTYVDSSPDERLTALITWAEQAKSKRLSGLAVALFSHIRKALLFHIAGLPYVFKVLRALDATVWLKENGGAEFRRRLLDAILQLLPSSGHNGWISTFDYRAACSEWTDNDEARFQDALTKYRESGLKYEIASCRTAEDLQGLRNGLSNIQKKHKVSFRKAIGLIKEELEHRESDEVPDEEYDPEEDRWIVETLRARKPQEPANEEQIRHLFGSLLE
jgi:KaiC/GvpD/RAD55 family RecA-like ATPase